MRQLTSPDNTYICPKCKAVLSLDDSYCVRCDLGIEDVLDFDDSFLDDDDDYEDDLDEPEEHFKGISWIK